jgi:DNA-binding transcriptional LysR family regulator
MHANVSFRQLQVFVAVVREGSLGAAAVKLNLSQSATSQSLSDLERQLNVMLFERLGRRLLLNDVGRRLLPRAEALLNDLDQFVDAACEPEGHLQGSLNIAASATIGNYLLPPLVGRFVERYPQVDLNMRLLNTDEVVGDIMRFEADLGMIEGQCTESRLASEVWRQDEMVIICSPGHRLAQSGQLSDQDLNSEHWVLRESGSGTRAMFEAAIVHRAERLKVRMELSQHEAIKQAVRAGFGLGCMSRLTVAGELQRGELVSLENDLQLTRTFSLIWHPDRYRSPVWQAFKVFLRETG